MAAPLAGGVINFNPGTVLPRKKVVPKACSSRVLVPVVKPYDQLYDGINTRQYRAKVKVKFHTWLALVIPGTSVHVELSALYCIFKLSICAAGTVLISIFMSNTLGLKALRMTYQITLSSHSITASRLGTRLSVDLTLLKLPII